MNEKKKPKSRRLEPQAVALRRTNTNSLQAHEKIDVPCHGKGTDESQELLFSTFQIGKSGNCTESMDLGAGSQEA